MLIARTSAVRTMYLRQRASPETYPKVALHVTAFISAGAPDRGLASEVFEPVVQPPSLDPVIGDGKRQAHRDDQEPDEVGRRKVVAEAFWEGVGIPAKRWVGSQHEGARRRAVAQEGKR